MNIGTAQESTRKLKVAIPGGEINFEYAPAKYTGDFLEKMTGEGVLQMVQVLVEATDLTIWKSRLEWLQREQDRREKLKALITEARALEVGTEERAAKLLEIGKFSPPEEAPESPVEGDVELSYPHKEEYALFAFPIPWAQLIVNKITSDSLPNGETEEDWRESF
jgi:hypothetical protein